MCLVLFAVWHLDLILSLLTCNILPVLLYKSGLTRGAVVSRVWCRKDYKGNVTEVLCVKVAK